MDATCLWYYIRPNLKNAVSVEIMDKLDDMWKNGWLGCAGKKWEKTLKPRHTLTVASPAKTWWGFWKPRRNLYGQGYFDHNFHFVVDLGMWLIPSKGLELWWGFQKPRHNLRNMFLPQVWLIFSEFKGKTRHPHFQNKKPRHTLSYKTKTPSHFDLQKWKPRHNLTYEKQFHLQKRILDSIKLSEIVLWDYNMDNLKRKNRKLF